MVFASTLIEIIHIQTHTGHAGPLDWLTWKNILILPLLHPDVLLYQIWGMGTQILSPNFLEQACQKP